MNPTRTIARATATLCAVGLAATMWAPAPASAAGKSASTVTISAQGVDLSGTVSSPNSKCEGKRTVVVYKQVGSRGGGDDRVIGSDTTSVSNGVGVWSTGNTGLEGRFWARVLPTKRCKGDSSPTIRAVRKPSRTQPKPRTFAVVGRTLVVTGTPDSDRAGADFTADAAFTVQVGSRTRTFDRSRIDDITVRLRGGDDELTTVSAVAPRTDLPMQISGGGGDDVIRAGNRSDTIDGGAGDDELLGLGGIDLLFGRGGDDFVNGNLGTDTEVLGSGNDIAAWIPGEGNDTVSGGAGRDTLAFTGSDGAEAFSVAAIGDSVVLLRSLGAIRMDLTGLERIDVQALGGPDTIAVNDLSGTAVDTVAVDLTKPGQTADGSPDVITVNGTEAADVIDVGATGGVVTVTGLRPVTAITGGEAGDVLQVRTLGGDDSVTVSDAAKALLAVPVELGDDD